MFFFEEETERVRGEGGEREREKREREERRERERSRETGFLRCRETKNVFDFSFLLLVLAAPFPLRLASSLNNLFEGREGSIKTKESGFSFRNSERIETKQAWLSHDPKPLLNPQPPTPKLCATCSRCLTSLLYKRERGVREISSTSRRGLLCSRKEGEGERERRVSLSPLDDGAGERGLSRQRKNKKAHERRRRPARGGAPLRLFLSCPLLDPRRASGRSRGRGAPAATTKSSGRVVGPGRRGRRLVLAPRRRRRRRAAAAVAEPRRRDDFRDLFEEPVLLYVLPLPLGRGLLGLLSLGFGRGRKRGRG